MATRNTLSTRWVTVIMVVALVCSVAVVWGLIQITGRSPASSSTAAHGCLPGGVHVAIHGRNGGPVGRPALGLHRPRPKPARGRLRPDDEPFRGDGRTHSTPARCPAPGCRCRRPGPDRGDDHHGTRPLRRRPAGRRRTPVRADLALQGRWTAPGRSTTPIRCR